MLIYSASDRTRQQGENGPPRPLYMLNRGRLALAPSGLPTCADAHGAGLALEGETTGSRFTTVCLKVCFARSGYLALMKLMNSLFMRSTVSLSRLLSFSSVFPSSITLFTNSASNKTSNNCYFYFNHVPIILIFTPIAVMRFYRVPLDAYNCPSRLLVLL